MTTPEAWRVECTHHWLTASGHVRHTCSDCAMPMYDELGHMQMRLTTQAETIRRLEERVSALVNADCAHDDLRETIRRLERERNMWKADAQALRADWQTYLDTPESTIANLNQRAERLEGEVARLRGEIDQIVADKYPAPPNWYLVKVDEQRQLAEQRAEAAEGRVRELEQEREQHVCRVPILPPRRPHIWPPDPATGEGA